MVSEESFNTFLASITTNENSRKYYSNTIYNEFIRKIEQREQGIPFEDKNDYRKVAQYDIEEVAHVKRLKHKESGKILFRTEDFYEVLRRAHEETVHGGRDVMLNNLRAKYYNINQAVVQKFVSICGICERKRNRVQSKDVKKPILTEDLNGRCQIDLIDYQSRPDGEYKFVLVYQDHFTKYVILRALKMKTKEAIVDQLFPIFIDFGVPILLHSDNGREFDNMVSSTSILKYQGKSAFAAVLD